MIILDFIISISVLFFGFNLKNKFKQLNNYDKKIIDKLFFYHTIIGFVFFVYVLNFGADSTSYWFVTHFDQYDFNDVMSKVNSGSATGYMLLLNYFPAKFLNLSYFTGCLLYSVLGYAGHLLFYVSIKENIPNIYSFKKKKILFFPIFPALLFLPNLHFWSSGVGKDTLIFFSIALFIYSVKHIKKRFIYLFIAILCSIYIRPHITLFLLLAFGIGLLFDKKLLLYQKGLILTLFVVGFLSIYSYVLQFIDIENLDLDTIEEYGNIKSENLRGEDTGSSIDTSSYPLLLKVFTFLYRPLFFDGKSLLGLVASFENLLLLIFTIKILVSKPLRAFRQSNHLIKGIFVFFIIGSFSFSLILGNLGIMLRQKTPFVICLVIFGFWVFSINKFKKNENNILN